MPRVQGRGEVVTTLDPDDRPACPPRRRVMATCDYCGKVRECVVYNDAGQVRYRCDQCREEYRDVA